MKKPKKVTWPQARAFSVHLLTASGSFLAFLSLVAASEERWTAMFWWLGLALFVDGIDGPIARKLEVKEILPTWSGELLDNIIDYVTYVLIPAFALYQRGLMGEGLSFLSAAIIVVSSAIYYADTGMKTKENFFKGFPVVWNMIVFTLFVIEPGEWVSFAVVVVAGILTFVPVNFLHPVRVEAAAAAQSRHDAALVRLRRWRWRSRARQFYNQIGVLGDRSATSPDRHRRHRHLSVLHRRHHADLSQTRRIEGHLTCPRQSDPRPRRSRSADLRGCRPRQAQAGEVAGPPHRDRPQLSRRLLPHRPLSRRRTACR